MDIDNLLISNKTCSSEKNYKYFIGYLDDDLKIKPLHIMLPTKSAYIKIYLGETKWIYFSIEDHKFLEKIMIFGIKLAIAWKQNFIANLSTIKNF